MAGLNSPGSEKSANSVIIRPERTKFIDQRTTSGTFVSRSFDISMTDLDERSTTRANTKTVARPVRRTAPAILAFEARWRDHPHDLLDGCVFPEHPTS